MPKPKSKVELLALSKANFHKLKVYVEAKTKEEQNREFPKGTLNRNIRDVLAHLHHWHLMMLDWYKVGMSGKKPVMPAEGYTWKTTPALNKWIWEQYNNTELEDIQHLLKDSFEQIQKIIKKHTEEELFVKKKYKWTGSTSLGSYLISASSSHYAWALKLIKKASK